MDRENPDHVIVAKNGSPILIGIGQGRMFIASEPTAFARYTKDFIALQDGEVAVVHPNSQSLDVSRIEQVAAETIETSPAPYPHWTIKVACGTSLLELLASSSLSHSSPAGYLGNYGATASLIVGTQLRRSSQVRVIGEAWWFGSEQGQADAHPALGNCCLWIVASCCNLWYRLSLSLSLSLSPSLIICD